MEDEGLCCFKASQIPKTYDDLTALHEIGCFWYLFKVYLTETYTKIDNYLNSRLTDLSMAWTLPHLFLGEMGFADYHEERVNALVT